MTDPRQPNFFKVNMNGKTINLKHHKRHKANSRQIAIIKFLESMGLDYRDTCPELRMSFKTGYNMGYKESKRRTLSVQEASP